MQYYYFKNLLTEGSIEVETIAAHYRPEDKQIDIRITDFRKDPPARKEVTITRLPKDNIFNQPEGFTQPATEVAPEEEPTTPTEEVAEMILDAEAAALQTQVEHEVLNQLAAEAAAELILEDGVTVKPKDWTSQPAAVAELPTTEVEEEEAEEPKPKRKNRSYTYPEEVKGEKERAKYRRLIRSGVSEEDAPALLYADRRRFITYPTDCTTKKERAAYRRKLRRARKQEIDQLLKDSTFEVPPIEEEEDN